MSPNAAAEDDTEGLLEVIEEDGYPGGLRLTVIVIALVLRIYLAFIDTTVITTAIHYIPFVNCMP